MKTLLLSATVGIAVSVFFLTLDRDRETDAKQNYVRDGDTVVVDGVPIRIAGLSCSELTTMQGQSQKAVLVDHFNKASKIIYILTGAKTYDRSVGWVSLDGVDIGNLMITRAGCQPCRRYDVIGKYSKFPVTGDVPKYCERTDQ